MRNWKNSSYQEATALAYTFRERSRARQLEEKLRWTNYVHFHPLGIFHRKDEGESQRLDSPLHWDLERTMRRLILRLDFFLNALFLVLGWGSVTLASPSLSELSDQAIVGKESFNGVARASNSWYNELESKKNSTHRGFEENNDSS